MRSWLHDKRKKIIALHIVNFHFPLYRNSQIHLCCVTDNEHHHDPAEERRHRVVPPVGAGDGVVQIGVP